jgi:rare lipoprotein A
LRPAIAAAVILGGAWVVGCAHAPAAAPSPATLPTSASRPEEVLGEGLASFYGPGFAGRPTASGERFDPAAFTAAHRTLRFGTCLRVTNLSNGRQVEVRVNDRGPYAGTRILDVSVAAARALGMLELGVVRVRLTRC